MTGWLLVQGLVFALWVVLAFRALFRLAGVMRAGSGQMLPGLRATWQAPGVFLRDPRFRADRRSLGVLTVLLLAMSAGFGMLG